MNKTDDKLGFITEVGDLGLGFDELSSEDKDKLKKINTDKEDSKEDK